MTATIEEQLAWLDEYRRREPLTHTDDSLLQAICKTLVAAQTMLLPELPPASDDTDWHLLELYRCHAGYGTAIAEAGCLPPIIKAYGDTPRAAVLAAIAKIPKEQADD